MEATIDKIEDIRVIKDYYVHGKINEKRFKYGVITYKLPKAKFRISDIYLIVSTEVLTTAEKKKVEKLITNKILSL